MHEIWWVWSTHGTSEPSSFWIWILYVMYAFILSTCTYCTTQHSGIHIHTHTHTRKHTRGSASQIKWKLFPHKRNIFLALILPTKRNTANFNITSSCSLLNDVEYCVRSIMIHESLKTKLKILFSTYKVYISQTVNVKAFKKFANTKFKALWLPKKVDKVFHLSVEYLQSWIARIFWIPLVRS